MKKVAWLLLVLMISIDAHAQSQATTEIDHWYVGAHAGLARVDDDFDAVDDGEFIRLALGRKLGRDLATEIELGTGSTDFDDGSDIDQLTASVNVLMINRSVSWNPYFLVGAGAFKTEADTFSDTGPMVQVGAGGMWDLNGYGLMLRADVRYRYSDLDVDVIDGGQWTVGVGLDFPF